MESKGGGGGQMAYRLNHPFRDHNDPTKVEVHSIAGFNLKGIVSRRSRAYKAIPAGSEAAARKKKKKKKKMVRRRR